MGFLVCFRESLGFQENSQHFSGVSGGLRSFPGAFQIRFSISGDFKGSHKAFQEVSRAVLRVIHRVTGAFQSILRQSFSNFVTDACISYEADELRPIVYERRSQWVQKDFNGCFRGSQGRCSFHGVPWGFQEKSFDVYVFWTFVCLLHIGVTS